MNTVVQLKPDLHPAMLEEDEVLKLEAAEVQKEAMLVFNDMADGGCSLKDCIAAVFMAGMDRVAGAQIAKRRKKPSVPICPYQRIVDLYHEGLPELPRVELMNTDRKAALRKFWCWIFESRKSDQTRRATNSDEALAWVALYFARAAQNDFICGRGARSGAHANWRADIDYVCSSRGMRQVIEKTAVAS